MLLTNLKRSALSVPTKSIFATTHRNALLQQTAFYTKKNKCSRELVKFPWIWPSDAEQIPKNPFTPNVRPKSIIRRLALRVSETLACKGTQYYVFGDPSYVDKIRDEMLPLVLNRIADAIDKNDYNQMDELMSPYLAKLYKNAAADLDAQGLRMKLDIDVQRQGAKDNYAWLKIGDPEAFDYTIPYSIRNKKYVVGRAVQLVTAVNKNQDNAPGSAGSTPGHNVTAFNQWVALEFGFVVKANVKADLYKGNHIIDGDSGMMEIPVAISTPHYVGIQNMANAVSAGEETETEEPFRWRVSDLFYITGQNNATNIA